MQLEALCTWLELTLGPECLVFVEDLLEGDGHGEGWARKRRGGASRGERDGGIKKVGRMKVTQWTDDDDDNWWFLDLCYLLRKRQKICDDFFFPLKLVCKHEIISFTLHQMIYIKPE